MLQQISSASGSSQLGQYGMPSADLAPGEQHHRMIGPSGRCLGGSASVVCPLAPLLCCTASVH